MLHHLPFSRLESPLGRETKFLFGGWCSSTLFDEPLLQDSARVIISLRLRPSILWLRKVIGNVAMINIFNANWVITLWLLVLHLLNELVLHCQLLFQLQNHLVFGILTSFEFVNVQLILTLQLNKVILNLLKFSFQIRYLFVFHNYCTRRFALVEFLQRNCVLDWLFYQWSVLVGQHWDSMEDVPQYYWLLRVLVLFQDLQEAHLAQAVQLLQTIDALLLSAQLCQVLNVLTGSFLWSRRLHRAYIFHHDLELLVKLSGKSLVLHRRLLAILVPLPNLIVYLSNFLEFFRADVPSDHYMPFLLALLCRCVFHCSTASLTFWSLLLSVCFRSLVITKPIAGEIAINLLQEILVNWLYGWIISLWRLSARILDHSLNLTQLHLLAGPFSHFTALCICISLSIFLLLSILFLIIGDLIAFDILVINTYDLLSWFFISFIHSKIRLILSLRHFLKWIIFN